MFQNESDDINILLIPTLQYVLPKLSVDKYIEFAFDKLIKIKFNSKIKIIFNIIIKIILNDQKKHFLDNIF